MHAVTQQAAEEESEDDAFYVFAASTSEGLETFELCINDKIVNVIVDSGASCNLMSEHVFHFLTFAFLCFEGLGELEGYQINLHQDDSIPPVAQPPSPPTPNTI